MTTGTQRLARILFRAALAGLLLLVLLGLAAPFIEIDGSNAKIRAALEFALGRKIDFGKVHLTLFSGPGFSLSDVTIHEDARYGLEAFAHVPTLQARIRLDKLLFGQLRIASLRLVEPSLNLVKRSDGTWNVVELVQRLSGPRRTPLSFFPAVEVSDARINFKLGARKTTLYIAQSDLTLYPERSGKLYAQFSGSPARTDRAGNGFGYFRGTGNWYRNASGPGGDQLDANITLEPSNLSELTTLVEGYDVGVHGRVGLRARIKGPVDALQVTGQLHLEDVHRWDLLPASGEDWWIRYRGDIDLIRQRLHLETAPLAADEAGRVLAEARVQDFLSRATWSVSARLDKAPIENLLPLGRRMGLALPQSLTMSGTLDGELALSNDSGPTGTVTLNNAVAKLPGVPPLGTPMAHITVSPDRVHLDPATIQSPLEGDLQVGGDYFPSTRGARASLDFEQFPVAALKSTVESWFGSPPALALLKDGTATGRLVYSYNGPETRAGLATPPPWSGQLQFGNSTLNIPGIAYPLKRSEGRIAFDETTLNVSHLTAHLEDEAISGSYRYNALARRPEHLSLQIAAADLNQIQATVAPALHADNLLGRLRFMPRKIPDWLASRNLEGDLRIDRFSINQTSLGALACRFVWEGTNIQVISARVDLPEGQVNARGTVNLASYSPRYRFNAKVDGLPWAGGILNAEGDFESSGTGLEAARNLRAAGTFMADGISLPDSDTFVKSSGLFDLSFADDWPSVRLSNIQATDGETEWNGEGESQSDGELLIDLEHGGEKLHLVASLSSENTAERPALRTSAAPQ